LVPVNNAVLFATSRAVFLPQSVSVGMLGISGTHRPITVLSCHPSPILLVKFSWYSLCFTLICWR